MSINTIYSRDRGRCHYCRKSLPIEKSTLDHKTPVALGGSGTRENLVLACRPCNARKGDIPYDEYIQRVRPRQLGIRKPDGVFLTTKR